MSDCFDHEGDAWASYERSFDGGEEYGFKSSGPSGPSRPDCRRCSTSCVWQLNQKGRWRLYENGAPHQCPIDGEFEDLS